MEPIFHYQQWLHQRLHEYLNPSHPVQIKGVKICMPLNQYAAALMQAYLGGCSLAWIAHHMQTNIGRLRTWRQNPQFLLIMDWNKSVFAAAFQEKLVLNDYSVAQCHYIAAEISLLENSLQVTVRMPLYQRFSKLGRSLISRHQNDLDLGRYDMRLFRRLFLFFLALEYHWPSPAAGPIGEEFLPLAQSVVWPMLDKQAWIGPALKSTQQTTPLHRIRTLLDHRLRQTLQSCINLH